MTKAFENGAMASVTNGAVPLAPNGALKPLNGNGAVKTNGSAKANGDRSQLVQSVVRALDLLNKLAEAGTGLSLTEVSHRVGLSPSTAHRILTTLQQERYVRFDPVSRLWHVGVQAFISGGAFLRSRDFVEVARPRMRQLMEETGETVNLAIEDRGESIYLAQVECRQMMRALAAPGVRVPMHCSGVGKALLASMADKDIAKIVDGHGLERLAPNTIVRREQLIADLERARQRGYAIDDEENSVGLRCVAAVIHNEFGESVGAISLSGPSARISDERVATLGEMVRRAAADITADYGGRVPRSDKKA